MNSSCLSEVWAEVLVVTAARGRGRLAAAGMPVGAGVGAGQGDGGGVVVQLGAVDTELADHTQHRLGDQAGPVGAGQAVQHAPDPVVVERARLVLVQPEQGRVVAGGPLAQRAGRPVRQDDVAHHQGDHRCRVQPQPGVAGRQAAGQPLGQVDAGQEVVEHRQRAQGLAAEFERSRRAHRLPPLTPATPVGQHKR